MNPRRRIAALLTILVGLLLAVQSAQATIDPTVNMSPGSPYTSRIRRSDPRDEDRDRQQPRPRGRSVRERHRR